MLLTHDHVGQRCAIGLLGTLSINWNLTRPDEITRIKGITKLSNILTGLEFSFTTCTVTCKYFTALRQDTAKISQGWTDRRSERVLIGH